MNVTGVAPPGMPPVTTRLDMAILGWFVPGHGHLAMSVPDDVVDDHDSASIPN